VRGFRALLILAGLAAAPASAVAGGLAAKVKGLLGGDKDKAQAA